MQKRSEPDSQAIVHDAVDRVARRLCTERCAELGLAPCWSPHTERPNALEWPNPFCEKPNCHAMAMAAINELFH